jgi:osmoprotectant transport system substrate-binding protein
MIHVRTSIRLSSRFRLAALAAFAAFSALVAMVMLPACSSNSTPSGTTSKAVRIDNKDFTEQLILSAMVDITLSSQGFTVTNAFHPKVSTTEVRNALIQGEIDLYPEYTGTALTTFFNQTDRAVVGGPGSIDAVRKLDHDQNNIIWGAPTTFNNTWAYALRKDFATTNNLKSLSDLVAYAKAHRLPDGTGYLKFLSSNEFFKRDVDGVTAMLNFYKAPPEVIKDILIPYPDDKNGTVYKFFDEKKDVAAPPEYAVMVFGTDSQVAQYNLVVMNDDQAFWPYYAVAFTARKDFTDKYPDAMKALDAFMPLLDSATMPDLNKQVDFGNKTPHDVALAWLKSKGFQK